MSSSFLIQKFSKEYSTINFDLPVFNRETATKLSVARNQLAATTVGNYALFGGGSNPSVTSFFDEVDAYSPYHRIQVYPGTKYAFNGSSETLSSTWQTLNYTGALTGYLKIISTNVE